MDDKDPLTEIVIGAAIEVHRILLNFNVPVVVQGIERMVL